MDDKTLTETIKKLEASAAATSDPAIKKAIEEKIKNLTKTITK